MKVKLSENDFIIFNDTQADIVCGSSLSMLSEKFAKIIKPFIKYDKKRLESVGVDCTFHYSTKVLSLIRIFNNNYNFLKKSIEISGNSIASHPIREFFEKHCTKVPELYRECFTPRLKDTDFFKKTLLDLQRVGKLRRENTRTGEISDITKDDLPNLLATALQTIIRDSILPAVDSASKSITQSRDEAKKDYYKKIEEENKSLKARIKELEGENESLKTRVVTTSHHHVDLPLHSGTTIGIDVPDTSVASATSSALQNNTKTKTRRNSI